MATPTFPSSLPAPLISKYGYEDDEGNVSKTPDGFGFETQEEIGSSPYTKFYLGFILSESQMSDFEAFYSADLLSGHKWFKIDLETGLGITEHTCRMVTKYSAELISNEKWGVAFEVETDNKQLITETMYYTLKDFESGLDFEYSTDILHNYTNGYSSTYTQKTLLTNFSIDEWS